MTHITATFSNGFTDTYHGDRDVRAAWMVVLPNGKTLSGHSLDLVKATKTAQTNAAQRFPTDARFHYQNLKSVAKWAHMQGYVRKALNQYGFRTVREHDAALTEARNAFVASCKIEVVAL